MFFLNQNSWFYASFFFFLKVFKIKCKKWNSLTNTVGYRGHISHVMRRSETFKTNFTLKYNQNRKQVKNMKIWWKAKRKRSVSNRPRCQRNLKCFLFEAFVALLFLRLFLLDSIHLLQCLHPSLPLFSLISRKAGAAPCGRWTDMEAWRYDTLWCFHPSVFHDWILFLFLTLLSSIPPSASYQSSLIRFFSHKADDGWRGTSSHTVASAAFSLWFIWGRFE